MVQLHLTIAVVLFAFNLLAGVWGIGAWLLRRPTTIFWYLLRGAQISDFPLCNKSFNLSYCGHDL